VIFVVVILFVLVIVLVVVVILFVLVIVLVVVVIMVVVAIVGCKCRGWCQSRYGYADCVYHQYSGYTHC
jgi:hypothetical protein